MNILKAHSQRANTAAILANEEMSGALSVCERRPFGQHIYDYDNAENWYDACCDAADTADLFETIEANRLENLFQQRMEDAA